MHAADRFRAAPVCKLKKISSLTGTYQSAEVETCQGIVSARPEIHRRSSRLGQAAFAQLQRFGPGLLL
jgi:hypothetical protein